MHVLQGFVDNVSNTSNQFWHTLQYFATTPYVESQLHPFLEHLLHEATATVQWWESLLWTVGGKLEFKKCFLYILHWLFVDKGTPYPADLNFFHHHQIGVSLVDSESSVPTALTLLLCSQATRTLGCMVAPDGQMSAELGRLIAKSTKLAIAIAMQQLWRSAGHIFYHSIYLPSMTYTLPTTFLSVKACNKIHASASSALLNACGYPRTFPSALVYAPIHMGGVGFRNIYVEKGSQHVMTMLLPHARSRSGILKQSLEILIQWAHVYSGFAEHPLEQIHLRAPHLPVGWIRSTQDFLQESHCYVHWPLHLPFAPHRDADSNLMETACIGP